MPQPHQQKTPKPPPLPLLLPLLLLLTLAQPTTPQTCQTSVGPGCQTCNPDGTACTACSSPATNFRELVDGKCPCIAGYYSVGTEAVCRSCGVVPFCRTCTSSLIVIVTAPQCTACVEGYYLFVLTCASCSSVKPNCALCTTTQSNPILNLQCTACATGYYLQNNACQSCSNSIPNCASCTPGPSFTCNSCSSGYFLTGNSCTACSTAILGCSTCNAAGTVCTACAGANARTLDNGKCPCNAGFYYDLANVPCRTCSSGSPNCATCTYGIPPGGTNPLVQCSACADGYYLNGNSCSACSTAILGCSTCNAAGTVCTACASPTTNFRSLNNGQCPCNSGYYSDGNITCKACNSTIPNCATCTPTPTAAQPVQCTSCATTYNLRNNACVLCSQLILGCTTCNADGTACTACASPESNFRQLSGNGQCVCISGYYSDGGVVCRTCAGAIANCGDCVYTTVAGAANPSVQCNKCASGYFLINNGCVPCTSTNLNCTTCTYATQPGSTTPTIQCLSCASGYYLANNLCILCSSLIVGCETCSADGKVCTACASPAANFRMLFNGSCPCMTGYYYDGNLVCKSCAATVGNCGACTYQAIAGPANPTVQCSACVNGYYLKENACVSCATNLANCSTCQYLNIPPSTTQTFQCLACSPQYYLNSTCLRCSLTLPGCSTCTPQSATLTPTCQTCSSSYYLNTTSNTCYLNCSTFQNGVSLKVGSTNECICNAEYYWEDGQCKRSSSVGLIVGLSVGGGVLGLALLGGLGYWLVKRAKKDAQYANVVNQNGSGSGIQRQPVMQNMSGIVQSGQPVQMGYPVQASNLVNPAVQPIIPVNPIPQPITLAPQPIIPATPIIPQPTPVNLNPNPYTKLQSSSNIPTNTNLTPSPSPSPNIARYDSNNSIPPQNSSLLFRRQRTGSSMFRLGESKVQSTSKIL